MKASKSATMAQPQNSPPTDHSKKATHSSTLKSKPATRSVLKGQNPPENVEELRKNQGKQITTADPLLNGTNTASFDEEAKLANHGGAQSKVSTSPHTPHRASTTPRTTAARTVRHTTTKRAIYRYVVRRLFYHQYELN